MARTRLAWALGLLVGCGGGDGDAGTSSGTSGTTVAPTTSGESSSGAPTSLTDSATTEGSSSATDESSSDGGVESSSTGADTTGADTTGGGMAIPDPGAGAEDWTAMGDIGAPGVAWQVGIAVNPFPYVEGTTSADGNAFYVFEAGPALTQLNIFLNGVRTGDPDFVHLHDGTGLIFGDEIPPDEVNAIGGVWTVVPGNIYVLEIHFPGAGFF